MRVLLSTRPALVVRSRSGLVASVVGGRRWRLTHVSSRAARKARQWRITPVSATRNRLSYRKGRRWKSFRVVTGQLQFSAGNAPLRLVAGADSGTFRGTLRSAQTAAGSTGRAIVNVVRLEDYVKGVVPNEMPALWAPAAVRAQAVAARSYAVYQRTYRAHGWFDVYDTAVSQVYRGAGSQQPASDRAVAATRRRILTYAGRPAFTEFSSSNGGYMVENPGYPYLRSGRDVYDPVIRWTTKVSLSAFKARFMPGWTIARVGVRTHPNEGGWVDEVVVTSVPDPENGNQPHVNEIPVKTFRQWISLRSGSFHFVG
jgi:peptidoglycan hydrolase-like amidase